MLGRQTRQQESSVSATRSKLVYHLHSVSYTYPSGICALKGVELEVFQGDVIFLTGVSGAGKTTLLKLLSGELGPTSGRIYRAPYPHFSGQVEQDLNLIQNKSILDNLKLVYDSSIFQSKKDFMGELEELAFVFGIKDRLLSPIAQTNGGMKQKVAIIRALLTRPSIFIADEPTSSLDFDNTYKLYEVLSLYNAKRGMTIIWASHNRELVRKFSGKIVHLENQRLVYTGHACFI